MVTTHVLKSQGLTMSSYVMINGKISLEKDALIPATDRGFLYGDCIYETLALNEGVALDFDRHMKRLRESCEEHGFPIPWSNEEILFDIGSLFSFRNFSFAKLKLMVTRGLGGGLTSLKELSPQKYYYYEETPYPHYDDSSIGAKLKTLRSPMFVQGGITKTNNYLPSISANLKVAKEGYDEVLWLGKDNDFTESAFANIFLISREGDLVEIATPPVSSGILDGITRSRIIELLTMARIPVTIRSITLEELPRFDEAFLTSSLKFLRPVSVIDRHRLHTTRKNSVFWNVNRLYTAWAKGLGLSQTVQIPSGLKN